MIARMWHGRVPANQASSYHAYLQSTGVADYRTTPGNCGVYVLCRMDGDFAHFDLLTFWESVEAIKAFAGDDYETARYYDRDDDYLLEREPKVRHFEVLHADPAP